MAILVQSNKKPNLTFPTLTGSIVTFNSQYAGLPLKSHKIALTATQSGSGTPSPDNVRTISGWSAINIQNVVGINQWDEQWDQGIYSTTTGEPTYTANAIRSKHKIAVSPNEKLYFVSPNPIRVFYYDMNKQFINSAVVNNEETTIPAGVYFINFHMSSQESVYNNDISINYPSTDTDYHTFNGQSFTIQIGSTVYGGEYDARTGVLTVTHGYIASYNGEVINEPWISSMDKYIEGTTPTNGAQVVYPLATPQIIQLPPCPIDTLQGINNIWADTGETTAQYIKIGG
jgi:hypothetical protein